MKLGFVSAILDGWNFEEVDGHRVGDGLLLRGGGLLALRARRSAATRA